MRLGREFTDALKTTLSTEEAFDVVKNAIEQHTKIKVQITDFTDGHFFIKGKEKINWLSTNWPSVVEVYSKNLNGSTLIVIKMYSNGTSITQTSDTLKKITNLVELLKENI